MLAGLFGLALAGLAMGDDLGYWFWAGLATGLFLLAGYIFVMRFELALLPAAVGFMVVLETLRNGFQQAHPAALPESVFWTARLAASRPAEGGSIS